MVKKIPISLGCRKWWQLLDQSLLCDIDHGYVMGEGNNMEETDRKPFSWYNDNLEEAMVTEEESTEEDNIDNTKEDDIDDIDDDADKDSIPDLKSVNGSNNNNKMPEPSAPPKKSKKQIASKEI